MTAKEFLEEIDYYDTDVVGELYEDLNINTLSDMLTIFHNRKLMEKGMCLMCQVTKSTKDNLCGSCWEEFNM